ncbi:SHOCT domain-containing protein [Salidesulfovibrio onnuriiensis]|uniref:SHOCT domain-containing protein n=1 Tax=Salidesulfovibrio onnuriiensis TaxID=2583823 RepID=UPI0011C80406|nr:SHOCT domain-containing protein [Salidesulfovibrio onnuriiensis]
MHSFFSRFSAGLQDFFSQPEWRLWPFGPGYGDTLLPSLARLLFAAAILGAILLFLRLLFGPKGIWRDKELEAEAEQERLAEIAELERQRENNEISELEFKTRMRGLK